MSDPVDPSAPEEIELTPREAFHQAREAQSAGDATRARSLYQAVIEKLESGPEKNPDLLAQATAFRALVDQQRAHKASSPLATFLGVIIGLGVWALFISGIAAIFSTTVRRWWSGNWLYVIAGAVALVLLAGLATWVDRRLASQAPARRRVVVAFVIIPLITLAMMGIIVLEARTSTVVLELVLVLVAALIPAAAYYLFLTTRRPSILNEFLSNLSRLGLLSPRLVHRSTLAADGSVTPQPERESPEETRARIEGYFQRFEALYGRLRFDQAATTRADFVRNLVNAIAGREPLRHVPQSEVYIADIFRPDLIIPIGLVTVLTTLGWLLTLQPEIAGATAAQAAKVTLAITPVWMPLPFAFLGAYFFGIQMLFRRFVRRDLGPNAYLAFANRIVLAIVAVWVALAVYQVLTVGASATMSELLKPTVQSPDWPAAVLVMAFAIGVFPRMIWQFVGAVFSKVFQRALPSLEAKQPLHELEGLTVWHETRLEEEDVENVPNMATVDLVDIMLHTQIPAERLVNWIDQAILLSSLGPRPADGKDDPRDKLRPLGLNTASQVVAAFRGTAEEQTALEHALGLDTMHALSHALSRQPNFEAVRAWRRV